MRDEPFQLTRPTKGPRRDFLKRGICFCISTHAAHEGAAWLPRQLAPIRLPFQLTRPTKGPRSNTSKTVVGGLISTHAAHEGAADRRAAPYRRRAISTHAAHEGAADRRAAPYRRRAISTHAAHEGAAPNNNRNRQRISNFNSRGPRRGRATKRAIETATARFQLTRPTKGPRLTALAGRTAYVISTHAAHEGAAQIWQKKIRPSLNFNSRGPRRGRAVDGVAEIGRLISTHAAHEGAARCGRIPRYRPRNFNSRGPRRGRAPLTILRTTL